MKSFEYIYDYCPESSIKVNDEQSRICQLVQDFIAGDVSNILIEDIVTKVKEILINNEIDYVCFSPGTTGTKTILRFSKIADVLSDELNCGVFLDTIQVESDPIKNIRYYKCKKARVKGKRVLLIGGVYDTGETFDIVTDLLLSNGAKSVNGLFVAKTAEIIAIQQ